MLNEVLSGVNALLLACLCWLAREWWRAHKEQHREFAEVIARLKNACASKGAVERAHQRINAIESRTVGHGVRLAHLETRLGLQGEAYANSGAQCKRRG